MTPHGVILAIRELTTSIKFRRDAAASYSRMGSSALEKAFEKSRAGQATKDADELEAVVTHLNGLYAADGTERPDAGRSSTSQDCRPVAEGIPT